MQVLPQGGVLAWGVEDVDDIPAGRTDAWIWDPDADTFGRVPERTTNFFCAGHALLPDGQLLVAGGHLDVDVGTPGITLFDPATRAWTAGVDTMNAGRWYPTVTVLDDGEALILGGSIKPGDYNDLPQVWTRGGTLRDLPGARRPVSNYPWTFLAPNGEIFHAGYNGVTSYLSTDASGAWTTVRTREVLDRNYGSAVLYDVGRVLAVGGGDPPTATAEVIDLTEDSPRWRLTESMSRPRRQLNATLVADGKVLVTGGTSSAGHSDSTGSVLEAEIWDPETGTWTIAARQSGKRLYHSAAVLLPDGRVLSGGGSAAEAEIYSPAYLFASDGSPAVRPTIAAAPDSVGYGSAFFVETPDAGGIARATWIGLSSATHAFNSGQRFLRLPLEETGGPDSAMGLSVRAPESARLAPPGNYLLFLLDRNGVPSLGRIVRIG